MIINEKKNEENSYLSLIVTFYNENAEDITFWKNFVNKVESDEYLSKLIKISFLIDNPILISKKIFQEFENYTYFYGKNLGKFSLVEKYFSTNDDKCFVKIIDPDDRIYIDELKLWMENNKYLLQEKENIIKFSYSIREAKDGTRKNSNSSVMCTENSLIWSSDLTLIPFANESKGITKSSDTLFILAANIKRKKEPLIAEGSFYIYKDQLGISSFNQKMKKEVARKFCDEQLRVFKIFKTYNEFNLNNTPSFWDYKWLHNILVNSNIGFFERSIFLFKSFNILKKIAKNNNLWKIKWNFYTKIKFCFFWNLFKKSIN